MKTKALACILAITTLLTGCSPGPSATAKAFAENAAAGRSAEALELMDPELKSAFGPKIVPALSKVSTAAEKKGGLESIAIEDEQIDGTRATLKISETFGDGSKNNSKMKLREIDGKWYVTM